MPMPTANTMILPGRQVHQSPETTKNVSLIYFVTLASLLSSIGIMWDFSWHVSIGRDKFLTPPHIVIYLGAIFGSLFSGIQVLVNSFVSPASVRAGMVKVWGIFYSSLGGLF